MSPKASSSRRSLAARLRAAFFAATAAAVALTGWQAFRIAHRALEEASFERLTGIRETKRRQVETYFRDTLRVVSSLARSESASNGLLAFQAAWLGLRTAADPTQRDGELSRHYREHVAPALVEAFEQAPAIETALPDSNAGRILQRRYLLGLDDARDEYGPVHEMYHETFAGYAETFGFEDLLLIEGRRQAVVYSSAKGIDLGASLEQPAYRDSNLADACRRAAEPGAAEAVAADFARYVGALGAAAAFVCAPVRADGELIGALAARLSRRKIDEVMTGGGNWRLEGLGETGETYLVGPDLLMRSDSRFQLEQPEAYAARLREFGYSETLVARIVKERTSVLLQPVDTEAARRALRGEAATSRVVDYRGEEVLSSFTPLDLAGLDWVLLAEIDVEEALAGVAALRNRLAALGVGISLAFAAVGWVLARRAMRPLVALTAEVERIRETGLGPPSGAPAPAADDEIARLWNAFSDLTRELSETLVSRDYFGAVLESMLNAVLVVDWAASGDEDGGPRVRFANLAARRLLNYRLEELIGRPISEIVDASGVLPARADVVDAVRPAVEREMIASDGRRIPVLFSAAVIGAADGSARDAVCVAQDITDWRRAQEELRRSRGELRVLAGRLLTAREEESKRLARELHDDITQRLGATAIELGKLGKEIDPDSAMKRRVEALKEDVVTLAHDVQELSRRLHPSIIEDLGLVAALKANCKALGERLGIPVSFAAEPLPPDFPREAALTVYRVAQECLRNVAQHSGASEVNVELTILGGAARLTIEDNGRGFDPAAARIHAGLGLVSMAERARLVGGALSIDSAPGRGARAVLEMPLSREEG